MSEIIKVSNLTRTYKLKKGTKEALKGISFHVKEGEVFGLLGPNGAGKTTVIKILTTLLLPTTGEATVLGYDVVKESKKIRDKINFVYGGEKGVYGRLTAPEYLYYFCTLYKIPKSSQKTLINSLLEMVGLKDATNQKIYTFSKGMVQRLHIARCLINEPKILFLDEPTIGLDPVGAKLLRDIVKQLAQKGITIILTTHYMQEADELCDRIAFIKNGEISLIGKPSQIKASCSHLQLYEATMLLHETNEITKEKMLQNIAIEEIKQPYYIVKFEVDALQTEEIIRQSLLQYGDVIKLEKREISLEEAYIHHMKDVG